MVLYLQTTLLNHILTAQHGKRIAVIENEVTWSSNCTIYSFMLPEVRMHMKLLSHFLVCRIKYLMFQDGYIHTSGYPDFNIFTYTLTNRHIFYL